MNGGTSSGIQQVEPVCQEVKQLLSQLPASIEIPLPKGADEAEIDRLSHHLGFAIPVSLKDWLGYCNGPLVGPGGLYGVPPARNSLLVIEHLRINPGWKQRKWIPVAGDGNGNTYVLDAVTQRHDLHFVYFVDHEDPDNGISVVASGLWQFLRFLFLTELGRKHKERTKWPFDQDYALKLDPNLGSYHGDIPLPWLSKILEGTHKV